MHFFDPRSTASRVDKRLAEYILENNKPAIFVVNKWDLAKDTIPTGKWAKYLRDIFPMLEYVPSRSSPPERQERVSPPQPRATASQAVRPAGKTGELNRVVQGAIIANGPPMRLNRQGKVYYATQVSVHPPTIVLMTNGPELFDGHVHPPT